MLQRFCCFRFFLYADVNCFISQLDLGKPIGIDDSSPRQLAAKCGKLSTWHPGRRWYYQGFVPIWM